MKIGKRFLALLLAAVMLLSGMSAVFAADGTQLQPERIDNRIDVSAYTKTKLKRPLIRASVAKKGITAIELLIDADAVIAKALKEKILTGQTVIMVLGALVDAASEKLAEDPNMAFAADVVKQLFANSTIVRGLQQDEKFGGAIQKLNDATAQGVTTIVDVRDSGIVFSSEDFGFENGDAYGFTDALVCSLLDLCNQVGIRSILGDFTDSTADGTYKVGNYNSFIPLYELLELAPISSTVFTEQVNEAQSADGTAESSRTRTVANLTLKPLADLITKLESNGADTAIDVLPKVIYALNTGMVNDLLRNLLKDKSFYGLVQFNDMLEDLDVSTDAIWELLDEKIFANFSIDYTGDGVPDPLPITKEQYDRIVFQLQYAADPSVKDSVSATEMHRLALDTDDALVCAILVNGVIDLFRTENGRAFARFVIDGINNDTVKRVANAVLNMINSGFGNLIIRIVQGALANLALRAAKTFARMRRTS